MYNTDYNTCLSNIRTDVDRVLVRMLDIEKAVTDLHFGQMTNKARMDQTLGNVERFAARVDRHMSDAAASIAQAEAELMRLDRDVGTAESVVENTTRASQ